MVYHRRGATAMGKLLFTGQELHVVAARSSSRMGVDRMFLHIIAVVYCTQIVPGTYIHTVPLNLGTHI